MARPEADTQPLREALTLDVGMQLLERPARRKSMEDDFAELRHQVAADTATRR